MLCLSLEQFVREMSVLYIVLAINNNRISVNTGYVVLYVYHDLFWSPLVKHSGQTGLAVLLVTL